MGRSGTEVLLELSSDLLRVYLPKALLVLVSTELLR